MSYNYLLPTASNNQTNLDTLKTRILQDETFKYSLNSYTVNNNILTLNFSGDLGKDELNLLNYLIDNIFNGKIPGVDYDYINSIGNIRNLNNINRKPSPTDDIYSGYNTGSLCINKNENKIFFCLDPSPQNAIWTEYSYDDFSQKFIAFIIRDNLNSLILERNKETDVTFTNINYINDSTKLSLDPNNKIIFNDIGDYKISYNFIFGNDNNRYYSNSATISISCVLEYNSNIQYIKDSILQTQIIGQSVINVNKKFILTINQVNTLFYFKILTSYPNIYIPYYKNFPNSFVNTPYNTVEVTIKKI